MIFMRVSWDKEGSTKLFVEYWLKTKCFMAGMTGHGVAHSQLVAFSQ
jgi:hypothetical protein